MKLPAPIPGDIKFFRAFARFEQVLKANGFLRAGRSAQANWEAFIGSRRELDDLHNDPNSSIQYLKLQPPWRQIVDHGALSYERPTPIQNTKQLVLAVRSVRNNLFHGEKTATGPMNSPARNKALVSSGFAVLRAILKRCPDVERLFDAY